VRQRVVAGQAAVGHGEDVHPGAAGFDHRAYPAGHRRLIHPMERLRERDDPERAEAGRQVLGPQAPPVDTRRAGPGRLGDHAAVRVDADRLLEQRRQEDSQRPRPAADVEQAAGAVQAQCAPQGFGQLGRVGHAADAVVGSAARVQGFVPRPLGHGQAQ
jgi:hypothetical protein